MKEFDVLNKNLVDNGLINLTEKNYYNAIGDSENEADGEKETENEDSTDYEGEEAELGDTSQTDLPKFRDLVRQKKLELKSQYGKAHIANDNYMENKCTTIKLPQGYTERECVNIPKPCPTFANPLKMCTQQICSNVPKVRMVEQKVCADVPHIRYYWVSGWRKKWREFKKNGGLAQLKMESKGILPITTELPNNNTTPTPPPSNIKPRNLKGVKSALGLKPIIEAKKTIEQNINKINSIPNTKNNTDSLKEKNELNESFFSKNKNILIVLGVSTLLISSFFIIRKINNK